MQLDIDGGPPCIDPKCSGRMEIRHSDDGGCSCHLGGAPCGWCESTLLVCSGCGIDSDTVHIVFEAFLRQSLETALKANARGIIYHEIPEAERGAAAALPSPRSAGLHRAIEIGQDFGPALGFPPRKDEAGA